MAVNFLVHFIQSIICWFLIFLMSCAGNSFRSKFLLQSNQSHQSQVSLAHPLNLVGTVTVVNQLHRFVLLDMAFLAIPSPGTYLACISDSKETALLRVSSHLRPPFLIADIMKGQPSIGEQVFRVFH